MCSPRFAPVAVSPNSGFLRINTQYQEFLRNSVDRVAGGIYIPRNFRNMNEVEFGRIEFKNS